jgi:hypothetical protein
MRFRHAVMVSLLDENTHSQGTAEACIGKMLMARGKILE